MLRMPRTKPRRWAGRSMRAAPRPRNCCELTARNNDIIQRRLFDEDLPMAIHATHVTPLLQVFDMRASVAFYCDVLGFELAQTHEPDGHLYWAMLKLDDAVLMLNAKYEDEHRPPAPLPTPGH